MGIPVVTRVGDLLVSRQSGAILNALDLHDLVTENAESYIEAVVALAKDQERLNSLRGRMRKAFNPGSFAAGLLAVLQQQAKRSGN